MTARVRVFLRLYGPVFVATLVLIAMLGVRACHRGEWPFATVAVARPFAVEFATMRAYVAARVAEESGR